ncbi:Glycerate 2-kinase [Poriferisphaera corsica]|uniref:Glycerate 2-kinase n=1 Tax=Poriferisphaera corsica TaxID=2528020 RepID=A0A517YUU6_9BACT|nr:glycerate kinase [Poriferisphaera corsica]QDU33986.1 Glycerate 2-kinase [Poriferisphaera corsica]
MDQVLKILVAPDSFKESLSAEEVAEAMRMGAMDAAQVMARGVEVDVCPVADGGEGTVNALVRAMGGEVRRSEVTEPLGRRIVARWGLCGETGIVEMAEAAGLGLLSEGERNPMRTTTYGVGLLLKEAMDAGAKRIIMGIGGSATNDGGCGAAQALGVVFYDNGGEIIEQQISGGLLGKVSRIDVEGLDERLKNGEVKLEVACDVRNVFCGEHGAARVYGWQKGANAVEIGELDAWMLQLGALMARDCGVDVMGMAGAGAAGGLGGGAVAMLKGALRSGIELVLEAVDFEQRVQWADVVISGEGKMDGQTSEGKVLWGVERACERVGRPMWVVVGAVGTGVDLGAGNGGHQEGMKGGMQGGIAVSEGHERGWAMVHAKELVREGTARIVKNVLATF